MRRRRTGYESALFWGQGFQSEHLVSAAALGQALQAHIVSLRVTNTILNLDRYTGISVEIPVIYPKRYDKCKFFFRYHFGPIWANISPRN